MTKVVNVTCKKNVKTTQKLSISIFKRTSISPYSVRMRENADQKNIQIRTLFTQWEAEEDVG